MLEFMLFQVVDQDVDVVLEIFNSQSDTSKTKSLEIEETSERAFEEVYLSCSYAIKKRGKSVRPKRLWCAASTVAF